MCVCVGGGGPHNQGPASMLNFFNFVTGSGSGIGKNFGVGSIIGYFCKKIINQVFLGVLNTLEILIGYFWVHPNVVQRLIYVTDFSHF